MNVLVVRNSTFTPEELRTIDEETDFDSGLVSNGVSKMIDQYKEKEVSIEKMEGKVYLLGKENLGVVCDDEVVVVPFKDIDQIRAKK